MRNSKKVKSTNELGTSKMKTKSVDLGIKEFFPSINVKNGLIAWTTILETILIRVHPQFASAYTITPTSHLTNILASDTSYIFAYYNPLASLFKSTYS